LLTFVGSFITHGQLTVISSEGDFERSLEAGYCFEDFNGLEGYIHMGVDEVNFASGSTAFYGTINGTWGDGVFVVSSAHDDIALTTLYLGESLRVTVASGNATAVGASFFLSDVGQYYGFPIDALNGISVEVGLSNHTTSQYTFDSTSDFNYIFHGFVADPGLYITSLNISSLVYDHDPTLASVYVGATAVPEPSEWGICCGTLGLVVAGVRAWRRH
jgi:hypothetical protein